MGGILFGAVALLLAGLGGGWLIKDYKDGAEVALINSQKDALKVRNDVPGVRECSVRYRHREA